MSPLADLMCTVGIVMRSANRVISPKMWHDAPEFTSQMSFEITAAFRVVLSAERYTISTPEYL